ncbi:uncharacterized protein [Dermacentor albipictus]|uniref:uncharacterized protein isoform X4 n=1 Tax=Dermacentor albipictus TaxID=60249 RepID=UPI0038FBE8BA
MVKNKSALLYTKLHLPVEYTYTGEKALQLQPYIKRNCHEKLFAACSSLSPAALDKNMNNCKPVATFATCRRFASRQKTAHDREYAGWPPLQLLQRGSALQSSAE